MKGTREGVRGATPPDKEEPGTRTERKAPCESADVYIDGSTPEDSGAVSCDPSSIRARLQIVVGRMPERLKRPTAYG